jgi:transcriptional regulator with XRE-family HTH domain
MKSGIAQLNAWMQRREVNLREAADLIGIHFTQLSKFINGRRRPGLKSALLIERRTGIPVEAWEDSDVDYLARHQVSMGRKSNVVKASSRTVQS